MSSSVTLSNLETFVDGLPTNGGISKSQLQLVQRSISQLLKSEDFQRRTNSKLKDLGKTVKVARDQFSSVQMLLRTLDSKRVLCDENKAPRNYSPEWDSLYHNYLNVARVSLQMAPMVQERLKEFSEAVLVATEDDSLPREEKEAFLDHFTKNISRVSDKADQQSVGVKQFRQRVRDFTESITKDASRLEGKTNQGALDELSQRIQVLEAENVLIVLQLAKAKGAVKLQGITGSGQEGNISAVVGLIALVPSTGAEILASSLSSLSFSTFPVVQELLAKEEEKKKELADLILQREALLAKKEPSEVEQLLIELNKLGPTLDVLTDLWCGIPAILTMLNTDSKTIRGQLGDLERNDDNGFSKGLVELAKETYSTLSRALQIYTITGHQGNF
ncbi:hypothetical protein CVT26_013296 [Gymnopilus dilepis]|uniref:Uncharacterized protein n=1 Tax=Gymnopilus dilepis TaxID=231916 RepID=A0A409VUN7_9AGAR|nr:hypothetical protein CVT26_013296 [Gymnopilus dilepis]